MNISIALALAVAVAPAEAIPMPPHAVIGHAWRGIEDPQLAEQLRPGQPIYAADCVVHLGIYMPLATAPQRAAIKRAAKAWRAALVREAEGDEQAADQLIGSSVNLLAPTPAPLTQAAASWCLANAPRQ